MTSARDVRIVSPMQSNEPVHDNQNKLPRREVCSTMAAIALSATVFCFRDKFFSPPSSTEILSSLRNQQYKLIEGVTEIGRAGLYGNESRPLVPLAYTQEHLTDLDARCTKLIADLERFEATAIDYCDVVSSDQGRLDVNAHVELLQQAFDVRVGQFPDTTANASVAQLRSSLQVNLLTGRDKVYRYEVVPEDPLLVLTVCRTLKEGRNNFVLARRAVQRLQSNP